VLYAPPISFSLIFHHSIWRIVQIMKLVFCKFLQPSVSFFLLDQSHLLWHTLDQCYSLKVRDQVLHPCKTRGRVTDLKCMVVSIPRIQYALHSSINVIMTCYCCFKIPELCHSFEALIKHIFIDLPRLRRLVVAAHKVALERIFWVIQLPLSNIIPSWLSIFTYRLRDKQ
jgi:hypothetical protein